MSVPLTDLVAFLDSYLEVSRIPDSGTAFNGLQVESDGPVSKILAAVDASQASIDAAAESGADLLLVHHGLLWSAPEPIVGRAFRRLRALLRNGIAVYSAHIPLDCHPEVGNNHVLARSLGLEDLTGFGETDGVSIGVSGDTDQDMAGLLNRLEAELGVTPRVISARRDAPGRVAVVTGAGGGFLEEARAAGIGTLITGEASHHSYFDAEEWGLNLVLAGHYATETVGVKALAARLADEFEVQWEFFDHPTGL